MGSLLFKESVWCTQMHVSSFCSHQARSYVKEIWYFICRPPDNLMAVARKNIFVFIGTKSYFLCSSIIIFHIHTLPWFFPQNTYHVTTTVSVLMARWMALEALGLWTLPERSLARYYGGLGVGHRHSSPAITDPSSSSLLYCILQFYIEYTEPSFRLYFIKQNFPRKSSYFFLNKSEFKVQGIGKITILRFDLPISLETKTQTNKRPKSSIVTFSQLQGI